MGGMSVWAEGTVCVPGVAHRPHGLFSASFLQTPNLSCLWDVVMSPHPHGQSVTRPVVWGLAVTDAPPTAGGAASEPHRVRLPG